MKNIIFLIGLAGAGKTTISKALASQIEKKIKDENINSKGVIYIDGDEFRTVFSGFFGYTKEERIRAMGPKLQLLAALAKQGFIVVSSGIGLYNEFYQFARKITKEANLEYFECYVKCDIQELLKRDQKGLYSGAKVGKIKNVVGIDIKIDEPIYADLIINGTDDIERNVEKILNML